MYMYIYIGIYIYVCVYTCIYICIYIYMYTGIYIYTYVYGYIYIHMYTGRYIYIYIWACLNRLGKHKNCQKYVSHHNMSFTDLCIHLQRARMTCGATSKAKGWLDVGCTGPMGDPTFNGVLLLLRHCSHLLFELSTWLGIKRKHKTLHALCGLHSTHFVCLLISGENNRCPPCSCPARRPSPVHSLFSSASWLMARWPVQHCLNSAPADPFFPLC